MAVSSVPASMIGFCHSLIVDVRGRNHLRRVDSPLAAATHAQEELVVFHRADHVFHPLQVRQKHARVFKDVSSKRDVGC